MGKGEAQLNETRSETLLTDEEDVHARLAEELRLARQQVDRDALVTSAIATLEVAALAHVERKSTGSLLGLIRAAADVALVTRLNSSPW